VCTVDAWRLSDDDRSLAKRDPDNDQAVALLKRETDVGGGLQVNANSDEIGLE